jgi:hypothetical protein
MPRLAPLLTSAQVGITLSWASRIDYTQHVEGVDQEHSEGG